MAKTKKKTLEYNVISKTDNSKLGVIKWNNEYRKYAFFVKSDLVSSTNEYIPGLTTTHPDTKVFDSDCMDEISSFMKELMADRKRISIKDASSLAMENKNSMIFKEEEQ